MWVLIILAASGGSSSTQTTLAMCQHNFMMANVADVREAVCRSMTGDVVYLVKNGKPIVSIDPQ